MKFLQLLAQVDTRSLPQPTADQNALNTVLSITFAITGSIALLVIVIGGFRYILAHGDPNSVSQAKKAILYAIVGLLVSLSAYSIVTFVLKRAA